LNNAEGNLITSSSKTADMFNTHFCNIYIGTFLQTLQTAQTSQHWLKSIPKSLDTNVLVQFVESNWNIWKGNWNR